MFLVAAYVLIDKEVVCEVKRKKSGKPTLKETQDEGEQERRRARSKRLPEPDQNPWYRAQFAQQDSSTEEELLSSEEEVREELPTRVEPRQHQQEGMTTRPVRRNLGLAVQEAFVRVETGLNHVLEFPVPGPRRRLERPLIGGRRVPIEDPVWENFNRYRAEHRAAVVCCEEVRQRVEETPSADKEDVER